MRAALAFIFLFAFSIANAQQISKPTSNPVSKQVPVTVRSTQAKFLGKTKPVDELIRKKSTSKEKIAANKKNKMLPPNFQNRKGSRAKFPEKENQGADPITQQSMGGGAIVVEPLVNIDGIGDEGAPHDPTGEVGLNHFMQAVNVTEVGVYTKEGVLVDQFAMGTLWQDLNEQSAGDPIILYDETAERWLVTEFTFPANLLVAVSETSDPLGSYYAYSFDTPEFPDYPKYSIWPDAYMVSTNESGSGIFTQYFIDRNAMLNGSANVTIQQVEADGSFNTEQGFIVSTPVDWDGTALPLTDPMALALDDSSWGAANDDSIRLITFDVDFNNVNNTQVNEISLVCTPYDSYPCSDTGFGFQCVPQANGDGLDALPETIMNIPKYRNFGTHESIVCCFVTDVTNGNNLSGIRWMEMRRPAGGAWEVYQEGTYTQPDGYDRFMGSIAIDASGAIGLGYSVSSPDIFVGLRYTGRRASDPLGQMTVQEYNIVDGEGVIESGGRYGDYAHMSVDPVNGKTFWFTSEYARDSFSGVGTRIVAFEISSDTFDLAITQIVEPVSAIALSSSELLTIEVRNTGIMPISNYTLSFELNGILQESIVISGTLDPDQIYTHQFTVPMDMSQNGSYNISASVNQALDSNPSNNTLSSVVLNYYSYDAGVEISAVSSVCETAVPVTVEISNSGATTLTSGDINIYVNDVLVGTEAWNGNVLQGGTATTIVDVTGLSAGTNNITIEFVNPNGSADELPINNSMSTQVSASLASGEYTISIYTDGYPEETSWTLEDESGNILSGGGPYADNATIYTVNACLAENACYVFTIFDAYGDGICCAYGDGNYEILDANGDIVASGGEFGNSETAEFCTGTCTLTADVTFTPDSGNGDGTILISASNGTGYEYSIDGGATFQSNPLFNNLDAGAYNIVVVSNGGSCEYTETLNVTVSVEEINSEVNIVVKPNPTDGFFQVELSGLRSSESSMRYQVLDASGKLIQDRSMSRYDGVFMTRVSLLAYADGIYYIRFISDEVDELVRVMKKN
jgi:CARDB